MPPIVVILCLCILFLPPIGLWKFAKWLRSTSAPGDVAYWAFAKGAAIGWLLAPSILHGGYAIMPAPAAIAIFAAIGPNGHAGLFLLSFGSLAACSLIAFAVVYATAKR